MKVFYLCLLIAACTYGFAQKASADAPAAEIVKVKIDGPELDRRMLLERLNAHGPDHKMKFELVDEEFTYRIVFETDQETALSGGWRHGGGGTYNTSSANADVYDARGNELFKFNRRLRARDSGATNAVAKEIIRRLRKLQGH